MSGLGRIVSLIGMPGGGKSTVGKLLAKRLDVAFIDTDALIEERAGCTVAHLFEQDGEPAFRALESALLAEHVGQAPAVISTGGGSVLDEKNRALLRERTVPVYLHALPHELWRRVRGSTKRPLLNVSDPLVRLQELYAERHPIYGSVAQITVHTGRPPLRLVVDDILLHLRRDFGLLERSSARDAGPVDTAPES